MIKIHQTPPEANHLEPGIRRDLLAVLLVVLYRPPAGDYLEFLSEFSDFLSGLVISSDKVVIVADFNIHIAVDSGSLKLAFISLLESMGVSKK